MKFLTLVFFVCAGLLLLNYCDSTEPVDDIKPGRRDYFWTVDTLANIAPSNSYTELWGYDPQHVWIAGDSWDLDKNILEFNGTSWRALPLPNQPPAPAPWALWGTDANNIWAADYSVWKHNGNEFQYYNKYSINGYSRILINDIYGTDLNHLYAVGNAEDDSTGHFNPFILQFNGNQWVLKQVTKMSGIFVQIRVSKSDPNILFLLFYNDNLSGNDYYRIFKYQNNNFTEFHNNELNIHDNPWLTTLDGEVAFGWDRKVYTLLNGTPKLFYDFSSTIKLYSAFWGRNSKDLFFEANGGVGHFNGEDIQILYPIDKKFYIMNCLFFEKEVFILYYEFGNFKFYVLRGKLN